MALTSMKKTSVGTDKLSTQEVLTWHLPSLAGQINIILATERFRVTFLPKVESPADPGDFRPIAISSVLARTLLKILSRRMREQFEFSPLQYAFLQRDGCLEASALLHAVLRHSHEETKPLAAAFLDISKAFDSVSHQAILRAGEKAGTPPQGSKLRPFWSHMLPKCNLCDSKIYLGAFVRVQIIAVVRPLQFSVKRSRITAQHVPRDRELKQVKLFIPCTRNAQTKKPV